MRMDSSTLVRIYEKMLLARQLDEILAQPRILGNPFYIGSAFEEALATIGMLMKVGSGVNYDILSAHYRSLPIVLGMGIEPEAVMRQAALRDSDPFSKGRQMVNHFSEPDFNIIPMSSCVATQAGKGYGTAHVQKMLASEPVLTVVHLGDAMCAEADFWVMLQEMALKELPLLVLITNNGAGIHTPYAQGSAAPCQSAWGLSCQIATSSRPQDPHLRKYLENYSPALPKGIKYLESPKPGWELVDGSDVISVFKAAQIAFDYIRTERKPYILEYRTERGRHHSSSSNPSGQILKEVVEADPLLKFETYLKQKKTLSTQQMENMRQESWQALMAKVEEVKQEPPAIDAFYGMYYQGEFSL